MHVRWRGQAWFQLLLFVHLTAIALCSPVASFALRFDLSLPVEKLPVLWKGLALAVPVKLAVFYAARLNRVSWRFFGIGDLFHIARANLAAGVLFTCASVMLIGPAFPRSVYVMDMVLCFLMQATARASVRRWLEHVKRKRRGRSACKDILVYGAGGDGIRLLREIEATPSAGYKVVGFLDDDPGKRNGELGRVRILGAGRDAIHIVEKFKRRGRKIDEIVVAISSASALEMQEVLANCRSAGVPCKIVPGVRDLLDGKVITNQLRDISVNDLLGRSPVFLEEDRVRESLAGRSILVTGAAGSIGSELCRHISRYDPKVLVLLDHAESALFNIDVELRSRFPRLMIAPEVGDMRDERRMDEVMRAHQTECIFHAAAYKHVPLMETHVFEAVRNNVLGTWNVLRAARRNGVSSFLMISSDKAVNPVNVMGATKRIAELMVLAAAGKAGSAADKYVSVRFGNVLGSNGSVVPLFQSQIARGGPVTVTHPDVQRYFMTIPEAVQLVLQAFTMGKGSEIFVLDMGAPVRIVDLARNMIRLAGRIPDEEIQIRFTGLRPGEKMFEELALEGENMQPTYHEKIRIFTGRHVNLPSIEEWIARLDGLLVRQDADGVVAHMCRLVPEYRPAGRPAPASRAHRAPLATSPV